MTPAQAYAAILSELKVALDGTPMRLATGIPEGPVERRSVVVGPPAFSWRGMCDPHRPDLATFDVWLIERADERAVENLLEQLPDLIERVQLIGDDCTVTNGPLPASYPAGSVELPAYVMTIELGL